MSDERTEPPLHCGATRPVCRQAILARRREIDRTGRAWTGVAVSAALAPWRAAERLALRRRLAAVEVQPPIVVVGHWRSGTTHLHNLLAADPRLGFVSGLQAFHPSTCVLGRGTVARIAERVAPPTRPLDAMEAGPRLPQEEEFAVANLTHASFYHSIALGRRQLELFDRYGSFERASAAERAAFGDAWLAILRKATLLAGGRRLVLKSPTASARMPLLAALLPGTRFVHIHRDPHEVLPSAVHAATVFRDVWGLQHVPDAVLRDGVVELYKRLVSRFLADRAALPVVDVAFDDLLSRPEDELERIYAALELGPVAPALDGVRAHLASQAGYRRNAYAPAPWVAETVAREWAFAARAWGYAA